MVNQWKKKKKKEKDYSKYQKKNGAITIIWLYGSENRNTSQKHQEMKSWIKKWKRKYRIEQIYVNNAWAVQYRLLLK